MSKTEYFKRLRELLACLPKADVDEACAFYAEAIEDRMADGMSEAEAVAALGTPGVAAEEILDSLPAVPRAVAKTRRRSNVLLWVLAIVGSPIWLALLAAFLIVVVAVYLVIWIMAACLWILAGAFALTAVVALVGGFWGACVGYWPFVVAYLGWSCVFAAATVFMVLVSWTASRQLARLSYRWVHKAWSFFRKERTDEPVKMTRRARAELAEGADVRPSHERAKRCAAVAAGLLALGAVLVLAGFVLAGCDPAVFSMQVDLHPGGAGVQFGGRPVEHPERIPGLGWLVQTFGTTYINVS